MACLVNCKIFFSEKIFIKFEEKYFLLCLVDVGISFQWKMNSLWLVCVSVQMIHILVIP